MGARASVRSARKAGLVSRSSWPPPLTVGMHAPPQTARTCVVQAALLRMLDHAYIFSRLAEHLLMESGLNQQVLG